MSIERQKELNTAKEMRDGWLECEKALMTSQEFRMGSKVLRRVDLKEVREQVKYWKNEIQKLEGGGRIVVRQIASKNI